MKMATLVDGPRSAGAHTVLWNGTGFCGGVYFCLLQAGGLVDSKNLVLLK